MKLSISLPDDMADEIKQLARESERSVSWWVQRAWLVARERLMQREDDITADEAALESLKSLRGSLRDSFPSISSVELAHQAFKIEESK